MSTPVTTKFRCDASAPIASLPHFWEHTVGSCHAPLCLRADWQAQMRRCREELGFRYIRFHGILCDDMGTFIIQSDKPLYSFFNADQIFDFLLSIGMKPFVELSFMPTGLASADKIVFHYRANVTPPKDYEAWAALIEKLAAHWIDRYGIEEVAQWYFEVWNEPNLDAFGSGNIEDYYKLYRFTANALKGVNQRLRVGGPATAKNAWIPEFRQFCATNNLPVDFISTHHYPTDAFGKPGDDTVTQLAKSRRSVLRDEAGKAKAEAGALPLHYTEWSSSSNPRDTLHDTSYAASFIIKTVMEATGLVESYSYWTFSDIFEENYFPSVPFHGGFGLMNIHGIPKPAYRAYQLLHSLGTIKHAVEGTHDTVDCWVIGGENGVTVLFTNFALPRHDNPQIEVEITIDNIKPASATIARIDENNANAAAHWQKIGSPEYLKPDQVASLQTASELSSQTQPYTTNMQGMTFKVTLPPLGIAAVMISTNTNDRLHNE